MDRLHVGITYDQIRAIITASPKRFHYQGSVCDSRVRLGAWQIRYIDGNPLFSHTALLDIGDRVRLVALLIHNARRERCLCAGPPRIDNQA